MRLIDADRLEKAAVENLNRINAGDAVTGMVKALIQAAATEGLPTTGRPEILGRAIGVWGEDSQIHIAIEEMAELIQALLKALRAQNNSSENEMARAVYGDDGIVEETADVILMLTQLCMIFNDPEDV